MLVAGVMTKRKRFSSVLMTSKKKSTSEPHADPQRLGLSHYKKEMVGKLLSYEHSEIHTYRVHISFKWRVEKDNIDLR